VLALLDDLDEEDFEYFDIDVDSNMRNIRSGGVSNAPRSRDRDKTGKDKFEAKRKIKKLNKLLKQIESEGKTEDIFNEPPLVRKYDTGDSINIVVDTEECDVDTEGSRIIVSFPDSDYTEEFETGFENPRVITTRNGGITEFEVVENV
jgi:hypothetical protein